jgi:hypothetical protein
VDQREAALFQKKYHRSTVGELLQGRTALVIRADQSRGRNEEREVASGMQQLTGKRRRALEKTGRPDGGGNISDVCTAGVVKDDGAGYWGRPSLIFFREKNCSAEAELLASLT